jgi:hypothetical protein
MPVTITPSEDDINTVLAAFLNDILPAPIEVVRGQDNRVPQPAIDNYVVIWPLRFPRLATNMEALDKGTQQTVTQAAELVMQIDVHGPASYSNVGIISTLFRSSYAVDFFKSLSDVVAPLYADDPRQMPFITAEQQYEDRWIVEAHMQVNFTTVATTQSANTLTLDVISAETDPASWPNATITAP